MYFAQFLQGLRYYQTLCRENTNLLIHGYDSKEIHGLGRDNFFRKFHAAWHKLLINAILTNGKRTNVYNMARLISKIMMERTNSRYIFNPLING